ncbi:oxidoreductase [Oerskovia sp. M15]
MSRLSQLFSRKPANGSASDASGARRPPPTSGARRSSTSPSSPAPAWESRRTSSPDERHTHDADPHRDDGEWTRRRVPDARTARKVAEQLELPVYDVNFTGYPQRMRDWNSRQRRR